jgi:hypothetical protein
MANNEELDKRVRDLISSLGESFESLSDRTTAVVLSMVLDAYSGGKIKISTVTGMVDRLKSSPTVKALIEHAASSQNFDELGAERKSALARRIGQRLTCLRSVLEDIKEEIKEEGDSDRPSKRARTAAGKRRPHSVLSCAFLLTNHVPGPDDWFTLYNTDDGVRFPLPGELCSQVIYVLFPFLRGPRHERSSVQHSFPSMEEVLGQEEQ